MVLMLHCVLLIIFLSTHASPVFRSPPPALRRLITLPIKDALCRAPVHSAFYILFLSPSCFSFITLYIIHSIHGKPSTSTYSLGHP